jgi:hypothetical protein
MHVSSGDPYSLGKTGLPWRRSQAMLLGPGALTLYKAQEHTWSINFTQEIYPEYAINAGKHFIFLIFITCVLYSSKQLLKKSR